MNHSDTDPLSSNSARLTAPAQETVVADIDTLGPPLQPPVQPNTRRLHPGNPVDPTQQQQPSSFPPASSTSLSSASSFSSSSNARTHYAAVVHTNPEARLTKVTIDHNHDAPTVANNNNHHKNHIRTLDGDLSNPHPPEITRRPGSQPFTPSAEELSYTHHLFRHGNTPALTDPITRSPDLTTLFPTTSFAASVLDIATDVGNMLKAFIGLNFMYVSFAFSKAGLWRGILGLIVITAVTEHCCLLLVKVKNRMPEPHADDPEHPPPPPTFADIGRFVCGPTMESAINTALVLTQFGYCVGYLIFISQTIHDLVQSTGPVWPYILLPLPPLVALAMLRSIRSLGPYSLLANSALLAGFVAVVVYIAKHFAWRPSAPSILSFPLFFGQMTAALEGIGLVIPVETSMKHKARFPLVLRIALFVMTLVLMTVGILGFATFGTETRSIILLNFGQSPIVSAVKAVLIVGILFTYPLQLVPVLQATESWILKGGQRRQSESTRELSEITHADESSESMDSTDPMFERSTLPPPAAAIDSSFAHPSRQSQFITNPWLILSRFAIVIATAATAVLAGASFGLFQSLVGSLGASTLAYSAPAFLHLRMFGDELTFGERFKDWTIFVFGVVGSIIGTAVTVWEIAQVHAGEAFAP